MRITNDIEKDKPREGGFMEQNNRMLAKISLMVFRVHESN